MTSIEIPLLFLFEGLVLLPELVNIQPLRDEGLAGLRKVSADLLPINSSAGDRLYQESGVER